MPACHARSGPPWPHCTERPDFRFGSSSEVGGCRGLVVGRTGSLVSMDRLRVSTGPAPATSVSWRISQGIESMDAAACGRALSGTSMCGWGLLAPPR